MKGKTEVSKALDGAFRAALMLTGSMQAAQHAVFNGIAATECYRAEDDALLLETVKAAIQRRPDSVHQSQEPPAHLPWSFVDCFCSHRSLETVSYCEFSLD